MAIDELLFSYHFAKLNRDNELIETLGLELQQRINFRELDETYELHFLFNQIDFRK